jgi:SAM-dependent methyltransferase
LPESSWEHVRFPEDVVAEGRRLLRPGGVFVGSPNMFNLHNRLALLRGQRPDPDPTHLHMLSPDAVSELLEPFEDVHMEFFGGRFIRLHGRLLSWDIAFRARRRT